MPYSLNQPDAADWSRASTGEARRCVISQLMAEKGVRFAPSLVGDEAAHGQCTILADCTVGSREPVGLNQ